MLLAALRGKQGSWVPGRGSSLFLYIARDQKLVARRPDAVRVQPCKRIKLSAIRFACPNPMQICACAWIYRWTKNLGTGPPGLRAAGPPGRRGPSRAAGPPGRRAALPPDRRGPQADGPLDRRAAGPSRAVGRGPWAAGRWAAGRWAAGLFLAKPFFALRLNLQSWVSRCAHDPLVVSRIVHGWRLSLALPPFPSQISRLRGILVPIALFSSLSRQGLGTRIEGLWGHTILELIRIF